MYCMLHLQYVQAELVPLFQPVPKLYHRGDRRVIWSILLPWVALATAFYGWWRRDVPMILFAIFVMVGAIYWRMKP